MTNEGSLKCDLHSIPIENNNRQKKSSIAFHESILVNHYFQSCKWVSLCVFYLCWTQVAKHNKSPKRMQSSIQWAAYCVHIVHAHIHHAHIPLTNDAVTIMPVTQMMLALKFPLCMHFIPKHKKRIKCVCFVSMACAYNVAPSE